MPEDVRISWHAFEEGLDRRYAWAVALDTHDPELWYVAISRGPSAAHGDGDGDARVMCASGTRCSPVAGCGDAELPRMPYALARCLTARGRSWSTCAAGGCCQRGRWRERLAVDLVDLVAAPA